MSAAELDEQTMRSLTVVAQAATVSVLLGAGASAATGLPDWDGLAVRLLQRSGVVEDEEAAKEFLRHQDAQLAAETARLRTDDWPALLRGCLYDPGDGLDEEAPLSPGGLHTAVAALAAGREVGEVGMFTINFDPLQEIALQQTSEEKGQARPVFARAAGSPRADRGVYEVHHLHGLVEPGSQGRFDGVVLTLSEFTALESQPVPWQVAALQDALQRGPLMLAGTSYRDPDIRRWMHQLRQSAAAGSGAEVVILLARASLAMSRERFEAVKGAIVDQWNAIGVRAVLGQDYADAAQILRELPYLENQDYRSPQQRTERLLKQHLDDFDRLQGEHAAQLDADLATLHTHLGEDANLTLWLADGQGQLVRWAANDRVHRSPQHLRRVPSGHDSPWLAGECLGVDAPVVRELGEDASTRRWCSVVAVPVLAELGGGPALAVAALSSATSAPLTLSDDQRTEEWLSAMEELSRQWSARLEALD